MSDVMVLDGFTLPAHVLGAQKESDFGKVGGLPKITMFKAPIKFIDQNGAEQHVPGQFKIIKGEQEQVLQAPIPVVIMGVTPTGTALNRAYYAGDYVPGTNSAPDCASSNGIAPDSGDLPQAVSCAVCPHAQWGSKGKGQACSQGKTLYVVGANDPAGELYQVRIPPTSLKNLSLYGSRVTAAGAFYSMLITNLGIVETTEVDYPILSLSLGGWLEPDVSQLSYARSESIELKSMIVLQGAPVAAALPAGQPVAALPAQQPVAALPAQQPVAQPAAQPEPAPAAFQQPVAQPAPAAFQQPVAQPAAQPEPAPAAFQQPVAQPEPAPAAFQAYQPPEQPAAQPQAQPAAQPAAQPQAQAQPADQNLDPAGLGPDSAGVYWSADLHSSGKSKIKDGTWKKRKGGPKVETAAQPQAQVQPQPQAQVQPAASSAPLDDVLNKWATPQ